MRSTDSLGDHPWKTETALALGPSRLSTRQTKPCPISPCMLPQYCVIGEIELNCVMCSLDDANCLMHRRADQAHVLSIAGHGLPVRWTHAVSRCFSWRFCSSLACLSPRYQNYLLPDLPSLSFLEKTVCGRWSCTHQGGKWGGLKKNA